MRFAKYHGLGNDFVIVDGRQEGEALITADRARALCDRHRGVGADGVLSVLPPRVDGADARMHLFNADGSEAEMCGNGLRCVVAYLGAPGAHLRIDTDAGVLDGWCLDEGLVKVALGVPQVGAPMVVTVDEVSFRGLAVSMGNPHFVLEPRRGDEDLMAEAARFGPGLESAPQFASRTNVEFIAKRGDALDVVVFERGVGITQACGTGAGAAAAAALTWGLVSTEAPVQVNLPGGPLLVQVADEQLTIIGAAVHVFDGTVPDPR